MEKQTPESPAPKAVVVLNRRARWLAREGPLLDALRRPRGGVRVVETRTLEELDAAARALARSPPFAVILAGGDGSYMAGVTALARALGDDAIPRVALAPGGTVSTVARNWGMRGPSPEYARRLVDAVAEGRARVTRRPTLAVRDPQGRRVGFIVGAGLVARFFEVYEREGAHGYAGAARIVARIFAGSVTGGSLARRVLAPERIVVRLDGEPLREPRVSLVCASVVPDLGLHMRLTYRAATAADASFHVVATSLGPARLGPQLPLVLMGRRLLGGGADALARSLSLRFPAGEGAYVLDGELRRADEVDVTPGPTLEVLGL